MTRYVFVIITALVIVLGIFYGGIGREWANRADL